MRSILCLALFLSTVLSRSTTNNKNCRKESVRECKLGECRDVWKEVCQVCTEEQVEECNVVEESRVIQTSETVCHQEPSTSCQTVWNTVVEDVPRQSCVDELVPVCNDVSVQKCETKMVPQEKVHEVQECTPVTTQVTTVSLHQCLELQDAEKVTNLTESPINPIRYWFFVSSEYISFSCPLS